jgi:hypothetical protein
MSTCDLNGQCVGQKTGEEPMIETQRPAPGNDDRESASKCEDKPGAGGVAWQYAWRDAIDRIASAFVKGFKGDGGGSQ